MDDVIRLAEQFRKDGVVCVRGALDAAWMATAFEAYQWSMANPSGNLIHFRGTSSAPGVFYQDQSNLTCFPAYRKLLETSPIADLVAMLWRSVPVWFMYEQVFLKQGGESRRTPWHQDLSYLPIEGNAIAVVWITFNAVAKEDSLEFVRGSHRGPLYDGTRFDPEDDTAPLYNTKEMPRLPDIEAQRDRWEIVSWDIQPGDVLVFHPAMLHGGAPTHKGSVRRTLSLRFFGEDVVFAARPGDGVRAVGSEGTNVFSEPSKVLQPGDPLRHSSFHQLRPHT